MTSGVFSLEMDEFTEYPNPEAKHGNGGIRTLVLKAEKAGEQDFEVVLVRSWEVPDFIEERNVSMKGLANAGYAKITVVVRE